MAVDRIESAIEKLTTISNELKTIIAVHEQRIGQQEKETIDIHQTIEKRREELNIQLKDVYDTMRDEDSKIIQEIIEMRKEATEQHKTLADKISQLEKYVWMSVGGFTIITFLITHGHKFLAFIK
jgi:conjugal transfer/entry exclusion protein